MSPARADERHPPLARRARQAAWRSVVVARKGVGQGTAAVRMRPDFLIAGAQRCGTTTLFRQLREHPNVVTSRLLKGAHWFDTGWDRPASWYWGHFPLRVTERVLAARRGGPVLTGEASPYYLFHPLAGERIARMLPDVRVVVLLRDPVGRAWSHYQHEVARGFEERPFERALAEEPAMIAGEERRLRAEPTARSFAHQHHSYLARGRYAAQLERLWQHVPRGRVLVLDTGRLSTEQAGVFTELCAFLGLPTWVPPRPERLNARSYADLAPAVRARLSAELAADRARLTALTGVGADWG